MDAMEAMEGFTRWGPRAGAAGVVVIVLYLQIRLLRRGPRVARFAAKRGFVFVANRSNAPRHWADLECLSIGEKPRALHGMEGVHRGRPFAVFDYHYGLPGYGPEGRAHMSMLLTGWLFWYLLPWVDLTRDPVFSVAVVDFELPPGARTADVKKALAPWRAEFGAKASLIRSDDGMRSPAEMIAALDRLNDALDTIARAAAPAPVRQ
jgi:hypothetical protein